MIKNIINQLKPGLKNKLYILIFVSLGIAIGTFFFAVKLTPWFYAINVRVRLYMDMPSETQVKICWDKQQTECLPLVPYSTANNAIAKNTETADVWLSELPPRPSYSISLQFESNVQDAVFHYLELDSTNIFLQGYGKEVGAGVNELQLNLEQFRQEVSGTEAAGDVNSLSTSAGDTLIYDQEIKSGPRDIGSNKTTMLLWAVLFSMCLWIVIPGYLLPHAIQNLEVAPPSIKWPKNSWGIFLICVIVGLGMVLLVIISGVRIHPYDPLYYLILATGGGWFNGSRLPGYPVFLRVALFLSGFRLDGVVLLQAVILALSVIACVWVLRKWISPYVAVPFVLLSLFSPAQINFARWILRESIFSSLVVLGVTAAIAYFTNRKPISTLWIVAFSLICGAAFLVRENGIILPLALAPVLLLRTIKWLVSPNSILERLRPIIRLGFQYLPPFVAVGVVYTAFSAYNYFHYGYFQMEEQQTSHGLLSKAISPANFDARGLLKPYVPIGDDAASYLGWPLYSSYISSRDQHYADDQTYAAFYPSINSEMIERGVSEEEFTVFHQASILNAIGKSVDFLIPSQASLSGLVRQYIRIVYPDQQNDYGLAGGFTKAEMIGFLDVLPVKTTIHFNAESVKANDIFLLFFNTTASYPWYEILFICALIASLYILRYENPVFLAPIVVYIANCALVLYSRMVAARVFVHIDILLVLQVALGASLLIHRWTHEKSASTKLVSKNPS